EQAERVAAATVAALNSTPGGRPLVDLNRELVELAVQGVASQFDKEYGGFGSPARGFRGTKFPTPSFLELLWHEAARPESKKGPVPHSQMENMISLTLDRMARGGIYDQIGGGFHRYSTERTWTVPHFEKMLYDNAQLVERYAEAYRSTRNPL